MLEACTYPKKFSIVNYIYNPVSVTDVQATKAVPNEEASNNPILPIITFIESLTNHCEDGRIICSKQASVGRGSLKFLLLNPAAHFEDIVKEARLVMAN